MAERKRKVAEKDVTDLLRKKRKPLPFIHIVRSLHLSKKEKKELKKILKKLRKVRFS